MFKTKEKGKWGELARDVLNELKFIGVRAREREWLRLLQFWRSIRVFGENVYDLGNNPRRRHSERFQGLWATLSNVCYAKTNLKPNNMRDPGILFSLEKPIHNG